MGFFSDLTSVEGKLHVLSILLTVFILTIFELVFFYKKVVPDVNTMLDEKFEVIENAILEMSDNKKTELLKSFNLKNMEQLDILNYLNIEDTHITDIDESIDNILNILIKREKELIEKNNVNTLLIGLTLLMFIAFFILFIIFSINSDLGKGNSFRFIEPVITSLITVICLTTFQVAFYNFGLNYNYPTNNELLKIVIENVNLN